LNIKDKAARIRTLKADDTFKEVLSEVKERQIAVFVDVDSSEDQRGKAHNIICALNEIENHLDSVLADEVIYDRKHN
jgi:hypothetical protein|tara:strand:+ start:1071 stop:1301 length:231 start_codon:yes stop_codon:yes gene_type:complete